MITRNIIEQAYCFFHQKLRVYEHSTSQTQKDDIECAIGSYAESMSRELYEEIAEGKNDYLFDYASFSDDLSSAVDRLEKLLSK